MNWTEGGMEGKAWGNNSVWPQRLRREKEEWKHENGERQRNNTGYICVCLRKERGGWCHGQANERERQVYCQR